MRKLGALSVSVVLLTACGGTDNNIESDLGIDRSENSFVAQFSPGDSVIPVPSNLLFSGSADGTLNIPVDNAADYSDPMVALNALDGFSTIAPITTEFSAALEPASIDGNSVHVYEVTLSSFAGAVIAINNELTYGLDFFATVASSDPSGKTLAILPLKPLKPKTSYMVAITTDIASSDGRNAQPSVVYDIAQRTSAIVDGNGKSQVSILTDEDALKLEPLRQLTNLQELRLSQWTQPIASDQVALSWTFTTQSISDVLATVHANATGTATDFTAKGTTNTYVPTLPGIADLYSGELTVPYYLTKASSADPSTWGNPLSKFWLDADGDHVTQIHPTPAKTSDVTIPLLLSIPNNNSGHGSKPVDGWPVVIFQHGITSDRTAMLAIADTMAQAGFAVVAIDLPLHGLPKEHPLRITGVDERTFDLDVINNTTQQPYGAGDTPDGPETSGTHFINLRNLVVTRDNNRQAVADLFALYNSLATLDYDTGGADIDMNKVYFVGHSLGAMVGSLFLALEPGVRDAVLGMPGGGIAKLLDGSATFGPKIAAGLNAADPSVVKGNANYEGFMFAAQTVVDSADPLNYASASVTDRDILMFEVVGDGASNLPDQVIPNNVFADAPAGTVPSPLAGTDPLALFMGLTPMDSSIVGTNAADGWIRFTAGDHASLLSPVADATVTTVMQGAMAMFLATDGTTVSVSDTSVVKDVE